MTERSDGLALRRAAAGLLLVATLACAAGAWWLGGERTGPLRHGMAVMAATAILSDSFDAAVRAAGVASSGSPAERAEAERVVRASLRQVEAAGAIALGGTGVDADVARLATDAGAALRGLEGKEAGTPDVGAVTVGDVLRRAQILRERTRGAAAGAADALVSGAQGVSAMLWWLAAALGAAAVPCAAPWGRGCRPAAGTPPAGPEAPVAVVVTDRLGAVTWANASARALLGAGGRLSLGLGWPAAAAAAASESARTGRSGRVLVDLADGRKAILFSAPLSGAGENGAVCALVDDSHGEAERERLLRDKDFQARLLEAVPIPLFYKDAEGRYLGVNAAFEAFIGRRAEDIVGRTAHDLWAADLAQVYEDADRLLMASGLPVQVYESVVGGEDGQPRQVVFHKTLIRDAGDGVLGLIGVVMDITAERRMQAELIGLATTDALTGLPNRRHFLDRAEEALVRCAVRSEPASVLALDLDHFKRINDAHGHAVGDEVLRAAASVLGAAFRNEDLVGRIGGEEFCVLLPGCGRAAAVAAAERLLAGLHRLRIEANGVAITVTASIGLADAACCGNRLADLMLAADGAMYAAKRSGRDRIVVHAGPLPERG